MPRRLLRSAALLAALACAPAAGRLPLEPPFIAGTVTAIGRVAEGWTVHVETRPLDGADSPKLVLRVPEGTDVRRARGDRAHGEDLREGQRVRVWITGPVMRSYPPQGTARLIVIDAEAP